MTDQATRRTQGERRSQSEDALLDAAAELIAERGVEGASLASIGTRAGASRGLPTHHFGSKDALVARLAGRSQDRISAAIRARIEQTLGSLDEVSALDVLRCTADSYLDFFADPASYDRALLVMWGSTFPSASSVDGMLEADRRSYSGWAELVRRGQEEGSIRVGADPEAVAVLLLGLLRGLAALLLTDSDITDMRGVRETCHHWITASLAPPTA